MEARTFRIGGTPFVVKFLYSLLMLLPWRDLPGTPGKARLSAQTLIKKAPLSERPFAAFLAMPESG
jgi:hypothetical protein